MHFRVIWPCPRTDSESKPVHISNAGQRDQAVSKDQMLFY